MTGLAKNPLAGLAALGLAGAIPSNTGGLNQTGITNCMHPNQVIIESKFFHVTFYETFCQN